jgi:hypothetical protein
VLGGDVLHFLSQSDTGYHIFVGARDREKLSRRVNLAQYTALNLGRTPTIESFDLDLMDVERTAETISKIQPDIIFNASTLSSWWTITQLPPEAFSRIDRARGGVWTPMHMVLARRLMKAVRQAGHQGPVVNASYPDVVNAALAGEGLSPTIGIGNIANAVPGIRLAVAHLLECNVDEIDVRFFAHHYLSYRMPSTGGTDGAPFHLTIHKAGKELPADMLDPNEIFANVAGRFRRVKGLAGQSVTASSTTAVLRAIADDSGRVVHAPGPLGLVGGYPVKLQRSCVAVALPSDLSLEAAIEINRKCQKFDGIDDIDAAGTVHFTSESAGIMRDVIGYDCDHLPLDECEYRAEELSQKFADYQRMARPDGLRAAE